MEFSRAEQNSSAAGKMTDVTFSAILGNPAARLRRKWRESVAAAQPVKEKLDR